VTTLLGRIPALAAAPSPAPAGTPPGRTTWSCSVFRAPAPSARWTSCPGAWPGASVQPMGKAVK